ncbi:hypothetical protein EDF51_106126 [Curtobacterium sp. PhB25]|uniref:hypothetical protein n=1 Tax=Curtobacterium sp. PhB25 TaxID=2485205 RepID=UPI00106657A7|nr:hypothetical protein [Curtobacterium sp. PhB25]TDW69142.1 hypothetical protein EDF51_106126 [Curtobacterium sp. PhB25]
MPKDKRLWMTFPIDFWQHPKIAPLSDLAFRTFVEMNGYSRMQDLDGRIPATIARRMWKTKALSELTRNDHSKPSVSLVDDVYVIWNYAEHQETRADREAREARNRANGAKGGRPPKNRTETQSVTESVTDSGAQTEPTENQSQSQSQRQNLTDRTYLPESSHVGDRASPRTDLSEEVISEAKRAGVDDLPAVLGLLEPIVGELNPRHGIELAQIILRRARTPVLQPTAYIARACEKRDEIRRIAIDVLDLPGVA